MTSLISLIPLKTHYGATLNSQSRPWQVWTSCEWIGLTHIFYTWKTYKWSNTIYTWGFYRISMGNSEIIATLTIVFLHVWLGWVYRWNLQLLITFPVISISVSPLETPQKMIKATYHCQCDTVWYVWHLSLTQKCWKKTSPFFNPFTISFANNPTRTLFCTGSVHFVPTISVTMRG